MWFFVIASACGAMLSAYFSIRAAIARAACAHAEARLLQQRGRIVGLEGALESLHAQHRKLAGRVYADEYWSGQRPEQPQLDVQPGEICENFRAAQREGPTSPAASCECGYCVAARAARAQLRAQAIPKAAKLGAVK